MAEVPVIHAVNVFQHNNTSTSAGKERNTMSGIQHTLKKAARMFNERGSRFVMRRALWKMQYERFQRQRDLRHASGKPLPKTIRLLDQEFELHPSGQGVSEELAVFGTHEPVSTKMYLQHLKAGDHVVDIGANMGYYLLLAARAVGNSGRVLGFEPARDVYRILERNVKHSGHANIQLFPWAIGAKNETTTFYESAFPNWGSLLQDDRLLPSCATTVQVKRLDDFWRQFAGFRPTVLRMDVEGAELMVLEGAEQVIRECKPLLFIEFHTFALGWGPTRKAIVRLHEMGYSSGVLIERTWDHPWMSRWARERRCWSGPTEQLLKRIESSDSELQSSVFSLILTEGA